MENKDTIENPIVIAFCGPNGAGKSTINISIFESGGFQGEYINADDIAKTLLAQIPDDRERNIKAAELAEAKRIDAMKHGRPFAFETVMSTPEKVALLTSAKSNGYDIFLFYVSTENPDINVQRVLNRVALGGHPVEAQAIIKRYHSSLSLLASAVDHADFAQVFDNSSSQAINIAEKIEGHLSLVDAAIAPKWVVDNLIIPNETRKAARQEFEYLAQTHNKKLVEADAGNGNKYSGKILAVTEFLVLQDAGPKGLMVHDYALLAPQAYSVGKSVTIQYAYEHGKIVAPEVKKKSSERER